MELIDFLLKESLIPMYAITLVVSIFRYPKYFDTSLKYFPILLMYTFLNELLGYLILKENLGNVFLTGVYSRYNYIFYNIYNIIFFLYFAFVFRSCIKETKESKFIYYGVLLFIIISLINLFFQNPFLKSQLYSYIFGGLLLIMSIVFFLREKLKQMNISLFSRNILFWISLGMGLFFIGYIPIKIQYFYLTIDDAVLFHILKRIHFSLIYIMYGFIIYGFLQMRGKLKI